MAPGARSEAMGAEIPAAGVPEPTDLTDAPVSTPRPPGSVPLPPSTPYREGLSWPLGCAAGMCRARSGGSPCCVVDWTRWRKVWDWQRGTNRGLWKTSIPIMSEP